MPRTVHKALLLATVIPLALALSRASQAIAVGTHPAEGAAFLPSRSGLAFINPSPASGDTGLKRVTAGRCGGMAFAALDYHLRGEQPPAESRPDAYVQMRNVSSIVDNAATFVAWSVAPTADAWWRGGSVGTLTRERELPRVSGSLASGPLPLGLTRASGLGEISRNHQVVAYGMREDGGVTEIRVYDPNFCGADDVTLRVDGAHADAAIEEWRGEDLVAVWSGLFVEHYAPPLLAP